MAVYKCGGRKRRYADGEPYCEYASETPWHTEACPGCGSRVFSCDKIGADKKPEKKRMTAADLMAMAPTEYIPTGVSEFDRVIGGGLVKGCVILFGGEKGTGKSTLLSMVCAGLASPKRKVLYAMAETGSRGLASIFQRTLTELGADLNSIEIMPDATDGYAIRDRVEEMDAFLFVVDALQVVTLDDVGGSEGSVAQCDAVMNILQATCCNDKKPRCGIIVNHLVKGGDFAGSETTQHLADTLLMFNYEPGFNDDGELIDDERYRVLSIAKKNRNGATNIEARFEMTDAGVLVPASELLEPEDKPRKRSRFDVSADEGGKPDKPRLYPVK